MSRRERERERSLMNHPLFIYRFTKLSCNSFLYIDDRLAIIIWIEISNEKKEEKETITACTQNSCLLWNIPLSFPFPKHDHRSAWDKFIYTHSDVLEAIVELKLLREFFFAFFFLLVCSVFVFQSSFDKGKKGKFIF